MALTLILVVLPSMGSKEEAPQKAEKPERITIVRFTGPPCGDQSRILLHMDGTVSYWSTKAVADSIRVGMTSSEVSEILKADFSPENGIFFPYYDSFLTLNIEFEDGKVSNLDKRPRPDYEPPQLP